MSIKRKLGSNVWPGGLPGQTCLFQASQSRGMIAKMKVLRILALLCVGCSLAGCVGVGPDPLGDVVVQASARVAAENPAQDKSGTFFIRRSLLCRKVFAEAVSNLMAQTGRDENSLRGATICKIEEGLTNGVYSLQLDVAWSKAREDAAIGILSATNAADAVGYVPSASEEQVFAAWIGPKQVWDRDGAAHFLGFSAMAIGRNSALSQQNIKRAELDAQAMAVRAFMGKGRKMTDVKAVFRQVLRLRSRHPLCPDKDMFACGYEVVSLEFPAKSIEASRSKE